MIVFDRDNRCVKDKSLQHSQDLHNTVKKECPAYAEEARDIIIAYLKRHDSLRLRIYLGEIPDGSHFAPWLSVERFVLQTAQFCICILLEAEARGRLDQPFLKEVMIRKYLRLSPLVIQGGKS